MTAFPTYSTGTVAVANGATAITGTGSNWTGANAKPGDDIVVDGHTVVVLDVTDATHLAIDAWPFTSVVAGASYKIIKRSPLRFVGGDAMADVSTLVAALNTDGFYVFVPSTATVPDPSFGDDGQYAFQATTGKLWIKTGGAWSFLGIYKAFGIAAPWSGATAYQVNDVATLAGSSYVCVLAHTNHTPPNVTYWQVLAAKGDQGIQGNTGPGYGGTSTTSLTIGTGSKVFTTQAGLAYTNGARVRASSAANTSNWMEGLVTYSGTTLTMTSDKTNGSGTLADWNLNVVGQPGAGDLSSANNLSDVANAATSLNNLNGVSYGAAQSLTATQQAQARANIGVLGRNRIINGQFNINQRGAGGGIADNIYGPDRWRVLSESASVTVFPNSFDPTLNVPYIGFQFSGSSTDKGGLFQVFEGKDCKDLRGKTVTLSVWLYVNNTRLGNMKIGIAEWTGTEDATTGDPVSSWGADGVTPTLATNWAFKNTPANLSATTTIVKYSATVTLGTTFNNLAVIVWNDDKSYTTGDNFIVTNAQLEAGGIATEFDQRPYSVELQRCQRYFISFGGNAAFERISNAYANTTTLAYSILPLPVEMRSAAAQALTVSSTSHWQVQFAGALTAATAVALDSASNKNPTISVTVASGLTAGQGGAILANNTTSARLNLSSEL